MINKVFIFFLCVFLLGCNTKFLVKKSEVVQRAKGLVILTNPGQVTDYFIPAKELSTDWKVRKSTFKQGVKVFFEDNDRFYLKKYAKKFQTDENLIGVNECEVVFVEIEYLDKTDSFQNKVAKKAYLKFNISPLSQSSDNVSFEIDNRRLYIIKVVVLNTD